MPTHYSCHVLLLAVYEGPAAHVCVKVCVCMRVRAYVFVFLCAHPYMRDGSNSMHRHSPVSWSWTSGASSKQATSRKGRGEALSVGDTANQQERGVMIKLLQQVVNGTQQHIT